jgi:hypothetical protein
VDAGEADIARRAASLLGAKAAPKAAPAAAPKPAPAGGGGDRTMALKSLKTPLAPAPGAAADADAGSKPKGLFARLFGWMRR